MSRANTAATVAVVSSLILLQVGDLLQRTVNGDYSAYALPAANWVTDRHLATPQLGAQYELDRGWRFNSPLIGAGPALAFYAGEIGQDWYLLGCGIEVAVGVVGFLLLIRRALAGRSWLLVAGVTFALLTERQYLSELINQRYTIVAYISIGALYFPVRRPGPGAPCWQWWLAGFVALVHPALLIASMVWVLAEFSTFIRTRALIVGPIGLVGFLLGVWLSYRWYLDPHWFRIQFLPHLTSRDFIPFSGWAQPASWKYALPSQLTMGLVVIAIVVGWSAGRPDEPGRSNFRRVAAVVAVVLALDALGKMTYLSYYLIGVAPAALASLTGTPWQRRFTLAWCGLAVAQCATELKLNPPKPVRPITRSMAREFLVKHTQPGDIIVVGPPFTLAAAEPDLANGRRIRCVVPMPLFLNGFDVDKFIADIRSRCSVYVGSPDYFTGVQREYKRTSPPVFSPANMEVVTFERMPIIVARPGSEAEIP